jgi:hypothetical protein
LAGQLVTLLLNYSQQLWIFRCGVVHGHTTTDHRQRHREELQYNGRAAYEEYEKDPFCIPSEWRTLFNRPVEMLLISDRDTLRSWLRSYTEARQQQPLINSRQTLSIKISLAQLRKRISTLVISTQMFPILVVRQTKILVFVIQMTTTPVFPHRSLHIVHLENEFHLIVLKTL